MKVSHSRGSYDVEFCSSSEAFVRVPEHSFVVTDENVARHWSDAWGNLEVLVLPPGEGTKSIGQFDHSLQWLAERGATRSSTIVAFGGGVIGDLAGFVAASYMRGVGLVQIPTSLLAQVDSAVGGKVGIDLPQGKNLVGAFYPPQAVYIPTETLGTLPQREFTNGMAEVCKYGAILDPELFNGLADSPLQPQDGRLEQVVETCLRHKADVVQQDEFETTGRRAILNFGHTVGHAIEKADRYQNILHGEAVAIGMVVEARLGESLGITELGTAERLQACLLKHNLPTAMPALNTSELLSAMRGDKKAQPGKLAFALLERIGRCKLVTDVPEEAVLEALKTR